MKMEFWDKTHNDQGITDERTTIAEVVAQARTTAHASSVNTRTHRSKIQPFNPVGRKPTRCSDRRRGVSQRAGRTRTRRPYTAKMTRATREHSRNPGKNAQIRGKAAGVTRVGESPGTRKPQDPRRSLAGQRWADRSAPAGKASQQGRRAGGDAFILPLIPAPSIT